MKNFEKFKTAEERATAFTATCCVTKLKHQCGDSLSCTECHFNWLELEAEEEVLPCPFCGGEVKFDQKLGGDSVRCKCGYRAPFSDSESEAIAKHNRMARAIIESIANGNVLAASPKMYECLAEAVEMQCHDCQGGDCYNCQVRRWKDVLSEASGEVVKSMEAEKARIIAELNEVLRRERKTQGRHPAGA